MKRVLIISPYFPPTNAADMQRIRMSLPYFSDFGWEAEVVTVDPVHSDMAKDPLLLQSIPGKIKVHYVGAFQKRWTAKIGLGSISLRSLLFYRKKVNRILRHKKFDLIYFSTTQFYICILGPYWKKKFGVPYVIDMQDPWHSDYYRDKRKDERPPKYWFSYRLNKMLEPVAMKKVDGLTAVSGAYLKTLAHRYERCRQIPQRTITFGAFEKDLSIAQQNLAVQPSVLPPRDGKIKVVYVGRGGKDMQDAISYLFRAFHMGLEAQNNNFNRIHFYFIGTSYAAAGKGLPTVLPVARALGVADHVTEITDRIPFYQTLNTLAAADALFVPGSNDPQYTASKIYPYVLACKPLLAIFHPASSVVSFLRSCNAGTVVTFDQEPADILNEMNLFLQNICRGQITAPKPDAEVFNQYSAKKMTEHQCDLFNEVVK